MGKTHVPPSEYTQGFNWRNSRNLLFIVIVLFELIQMITWPLQQYNTTDRDIITHNNLGKKINYGTKILKFFF